MYFDDLSLYSYELPRALPNVLNVGWLEKGRVFPTGDVPTGFTEILKQWSFRASANRMRGYEICRFCPLTGYDQVSTESNGEKHWLGAAEIWVPDGAGLIFAAPNLVIHYIEAHRYLPPASFIDAVLLPMADSWDAEAMAEQLFRHAFTDQIS